MDRKTQNGPIKTIKVIKVGFSGSLCLAYFPNGLFCFIFIDPLDATELQFRKCGHRSVFLLSFNTLSCRPDGSFM